MKKRIYLSSPTMNGTEMNYIKEAFDTNWIAPLGKNVDEFEKELASYVGAGHAAAVSAGTAAIHMALNYLGVSNGDVVICSTLTFSATCNPIIYQGGVPVFVDCEKDSWNMDPKLLRKALEQYPHAKAVVLVNLYGTPAKLDEIEAICNEFQVPLVEDAAESLGATYKGKQTGTFGEFGVFSFNGNKIITTSGGGMLVSDDEEAIKKVRFWSTQSRENERHYEHKEIGYNYRMSNIVAGIGRGQMNSLDRHIELKKNIYITYKEAFKDISQITMNPIPDECEPNYWLSCMILNEDSKISPLEIMQALEKSNIECRPIWKPMHLQPVFQSYECMTNSGLHKNKDQFDTVSEDIFNRGVCLPSDIKNTKEDMERIIHIIKKLFQN